MVSMSLSKWWLPRTCTVAHMGARDWAGLLARFTVARCACGTRSVSQQVDIGNLQRTVADLMEAAGRGISLT